MANGLDIVAVGVEHEGGVIIRVVSRAQARRAIVLAAGGDCGGVEGIDRLAGCSGERDMDVLVAEPDASPIQKNGFQLAPKPTAAP